MHTCTTKLEIFYIRICCLPNVANFCQRACVCVVFWRKTALSANIGNVVLSLNKLVEREWRERRETRARGQMAILPLTFSEGDIWHDITTTTIGPLIARCVSFSISMNKWEPITHEANPRMKLFFWLMTCSLPPASVLYDYPFIEYRITDLVVLQERVDCCLRRRLGSRKGGWIMWAHTLIYASQSIRPHVLPIRTADPHVLRPLHLPPGEDETFAIIVLWRRAEKPCGKP